MFGFAEGLNGIAAQGLKAKWCYLYANGWFAFAEVVNAYLRKIGFASCGYKGGNFALVVFTAF